MLFILSKIQLKHQSWTVQKMSFEGLKMYFSKIWNLNRRNLSHGNSSRLARMILWVPQFLKNYVQDQSVDDFIYQDYVIQSPHQRNGHTFPSSTAVWLKSQMNSNCMIRPRTLSTSSVNVEVASCPPNPA